MTYSEFVSTYWFYHFRMSASKAKEEKKYVQLSPDTVSMLAESIGISQNGLSANVSRALAEDVSYRCRELATVRMIIIFFYKLSSLISTL